MSVWWRAWWGKKRKTEVFTASMNFGLGEDIDALRDMVSRFAADRIVPAIERLVMAYLDLRADDDEPFAATYRRIGAAPFHAALYPAT